MARDDTSLPSGRQGIAPHRRPQIIQKATLRRGRQGWYLTCDLPKAFRLIEMSFIIPIPRELTEGNVSPALAEGAQVPVYIRLYVNAADGDAPGSVD